MFSLLRNNLLFTEGSIILVIVLTVATTGFVFFRPLFYIALAFLLFCCYFFRNPERKCIQAEEDKTLIVSPADGRVVNIQYDPHNGFEGYAYKVSIFLSVFDVHVNRMPVTGTIESITYVPGSFMPAFVEKSSHLNEHNDVIIVRDDGQKIVVRQIAGIIARRIRCWVVPGSYHNVSERYGMIMFGSRVDLLLPGSTELYITRDQSVVGGQTIIGRIPCK